MKVNIQVSDIEEEVRNTDVKDDGHRTNDNKESNEENRIVTRKA